MLKVMLNSGKNIDDLYHFTPRADLFYLICSDRILRAGDKEESGPTHKGKNPFISFTRSHNLHKTSHKNYRYGFIIDGQKFSDRYRLEPISYVGHQVAKGTNNFQIMRITRYQNGKCKASTKPYGTVDISEETFSKLADYIEKLPEDLKNKKKLSHKEGGTRNVSGVGAPIAEQYAVGTPNGISIKTKNIPEAANLGSILSQNENIDESEERVWNDKVSIDNCLKGVIIANDLTDSERYFIQEGLQFLYEAGYAIKPSQHAIGFKPDKTKGNFIIERI